MVPAREEVLSGDGGPAAAPAQGRCTASVDTAALAALTSCPGALTRLQVCVLADWGCGAWAQQLAWVGDGVGLSSSGSSGRRVVGLSLGCREGQV